MTAARAALPRVLVIMGSGETAPTMTKVHRSQLDRLGVKPVPAVLLDTPCGFQENAAQISARAVEYFNESVGHDIAVANWRSATHDTTTREAAIDRVRQARYVFAGPGSPTYALGIWQGSALPDLLADKLRAGGIVCFASAAALTLGLATVPVYEIYKVGEAPAWRDGLDLLGPLGLSVAVIPHYDNAEGGNHDTRFCYLGERRLALLEAALPAGAFVLGVDEHTALVLDLDTSTATVAGNGGVTVRHHGESIVFPSGTSLPIEALRDASTASAAVPVAPRTAAVAVSAAARSALLAEADRLDRACSDALSGGRVDDAVAAILELEQTILEWSRDTLQSDEPDRARSTLRGMVVRLGAVAAAGWHDHAQLIAPFVEAVLDARRAAREGQDFRLADELRDSLVAAGLEVQDGPDGSTWRVGHWHAGG